MGREASGREFDTLVALVTGAASGIGRATVTELARRGATVAALGVVPPNEGDEAHAFMADVADSASVKRAVTETVERLGRLDVVVNGAGIGAVGGIEDNDEAEWHRVFDVNVLGMVRVSRAALPHLRRSKAAAIVNVSSIAATAGLPQRVCYSASKGAVLSLTLAMAADLLADNVRVNCVCLGTVDTPWVHRLLDVVGPGGKVGLRSDSQWQVPEAEVAIVVSEGGRDILGYTLGNELAKEFRQALRTMRSACHGAPRARHRGPRGRCQEARSVDGVLGTLRRPALSACSRRGGPVRRREYCPRSRPRAGTRE